VIVVHGTWAAPQLDRPRWYQPIDSASTADRFVRKLDTELQKRGSPARSWAHCTDGNPIFQWSGENSWIARTHAASALADYVAKLLNDGWLCHIIAHSHGGNVVLEALHQITTPAGIHKRGGKLVTLGTPFLATTSPITKSAYRVRSVLKVFSMISYTFLLRFFVAGWWVWMDTTPSLEKAVFVFFGIGTIGMMTILNWFVVRPWANRKRNRNRSNFVQTPRMQPMFRRGARAARSSPMNEFLQMRLQLRTSDQVPLQLPLLAMGSAMDEAWQILHHFRSIENPLAVRSSALSYLFSSLRSHMTQGADIARIHGAKSYNDLGKIAKLHLASVYLFWLTSPALLAYAFSADNSAVGIIAIAVAAFVILPMMVFIGTHVFGPNYYSAFLSPFRWFLRLVNFLISIPVKITTYIVRRKGWSVLLAMAMGMEGYRFTLPVVEQWPRNIPESVVRYEDMPRAAEQRAMGNRSAWVARHLGDVSQTFAKMVITAADISLLLNTIEEDQSLVHAAYYTDDDCIARIADWIADIE
jgi:hypothetical protein